jgi:hypothetical protein
MQLCSQLVSKEIVHSINSMVESESRHNDGQADSLIRLPTVQTHEHIYSLQSQSECKS